MIIGLTGEMGAGKTTLANMVCSSHSYARMSFARRFKLAMCHLFNWDERLIDNYEYKNGVDRVTGVVRRKLMQEFATEYIRERIDPIFHTKITAIDALTHMKMFKEFVIFDDVRHPDEVELIENIGGLVIRVIRPNNPHEQHAHKSEGYVIPVHDVLVNDSDVSTMYEKFIKMGVVWPASVSNILPYFSCCHKLENIIKGWEHGKGVSTNSSNAGSR